MLSTTPRRLNQCRKVAGLLIETNRVALSNARLGKEVFERLTRSAYQMFDQAGVADAVMRAAGFRPPEPEPDADGAACVQPTGPKPISPSTGAAVEPRPLSLTSLDNDRTILEVGDGRVELNGCERKVLTDMLTSKERTGIEITDALLKLSPDEARSLLWSDQINHDEAKGTPVRAVPAPVPVSEHPMRPAATPEKTACVTSRFLEALVRCLTPAGVLRGSDSSETGSRLAGGEKQ